MHIQLVIRFSKLRGVTDILRFQEVPDLNPAQDDSYPLLSQFSSVSHNKS